MPKPTAARTTTPATTPPAIAPAGVDDAADVAECVGLEEVVVEDPVLEGVTVTVIIENDEYDAVTEPPEYVGYTVTTNATELQPKYVNAVFGKTKTSYWQYGAPLSQVVA